MRHLIEQATHALQGKIRNTPVEYTPKLSKLLGQPVYLRLECLQVTGIFRWFLKHHEYLIEPSAAKLSYAT
jgi:threonine dehydratase